MVDGCGYKRDPCDTTVLCLDCGGNYKSTRTYT